MRQFRAFFTTIWQDTIFYKGESFVWLIMEALPVLVMSSLWTSLEAAGQITSDQSSSLVFYYILTLLISRLASTYFDDWFAEEIKDGRVSRYLLKPISVYVYIMAQQLANRLIGTLYTLPIYWPTLSTLVTFPRLAIFFALLSLSYIQKFMFSWIISLTAFWVDQFSILTHFKWILEGVFGGAWLPLSFFPVWWQTTSKFTPFYNWYYFPITLLTTTSVTTSEIISGFSISILWTLVLILAGRVMWKKAIYHYSAVGG